MNIFNRINHWIDRRANKPVTIFEKKPWWTTSSVLEWDIDEVARFLGVPPEKSTDGRSVTFRLHEKEWEIKLVVCLCGIAYVTITSPSQRDRPFQTGIKCLHARVKNHYVHGGDYLWFGAESGNNAGNVYLIIQKFPHLGVETSASTPDVAHVLRSSWQHPDNDNLA